MTDALYTIQESTLTDIADAVRSKKGTSAPIAVTDLADEIESISGGGDSPISLKATYKNNTPSNAYGEIVLSANDDDYSGNYDIMWGDANGVMSNYSKIDTVTLDVDDGKTMGIIEMREYNAIPKYATRICAVQNGTIVTSFDIPSGKVWDAEHYGTKVATYMVISDPHVQYTTGHDDVQVAFEYGNQREDVEAIFGSGDLTRNGTTSELDEWLTDRDTWSPDTPVYTCPGNHEAHKSTSLYTTNPTGLRKYLDSDWVDETDAFFYKVINNDVFVFVPIFKGTTDDASHTMFDADTLAELETVLETYRNQRVFLFAHVFPHWETVGIKYNGFACGNGAYTYDVWGNPQTSNRPLADRTAFLNLLDHYKNVIWFSGHSHIKYEYQKLYQALNIMQYKGGARFVHVSSLTVPRDIIDGTVTDLIYAESEGMLMDVYPNAIRLRSRNFVGEKFYGACEYIIDTTPVTIPPNTKTLVSISATKTKTSYYTDETLSTADITVIATYSDNTTADVSADAVYDTQYVDISTTGTYTIGISYTYGEDTETTSVQITSTVRPSVKTLASIVASKVTTSYTVNDSLSTSDITAVATYSDTTTANISNGDLVFDTSNVDMTTAGAYVIGVSYTEDGVTATTTVGITVSGADEPTVVADFTFTGTLTAGGQNATPSVNDNKGSIYNTDYAWYNDSDGVAVGKTLYYRWVSNVGISNADKIGLKGDIKGSPSSSSGTEIADYNMDATTWTKITKTADGTDAHLSSTNKSIVLRCRSSSSATATFPVTVNARLQIGYKDA